MMPDGLRLARELLRGAPVDLLCWPTHDYKWPDAGLAAGMLTIRFGGLAGELDLAGHLSRLYALSGPEVYLTSIYHGAVSAELVARIRGLQDGCYFSDPICDIESKIVNARFARGALLSQRPITMNGHSGASNGGANGRYDRLVAAYDRFAAEAGLEPRDLTPGGVDLPLYHGTLVAGCQQRVKARHFPDDNSLRHDPERLLYYLIGSSGVFGASRPPDLAARFGQAARALGVTSGGATLPPLREPARPPTGLAVDPGGQHRLLVDAGQAGITDILGAVRLAQAILPPFAGIAQPSPPILPSNPDLKSGPEAGGPGGKARAAPKARRPAGRPALR